MILNFLYHLNSRLGKLPPFKRCGLCVVFCLVLGTLCVRGEEVTYGLSFDSYLTPSSGRTMLLLDDGRPLQFDRLLRIDAKLRIRPEKRQYGFILRMISENGDNIDVVVAVDSDGQNERHYLAAVFNNTIVVVAEALNYQSWDDLSVVVDREAGTAGISYSGKTISLDIPVKSFTSLVVSFGQCTHSEFRTDDVAPFDLKDVFVSVDERPSRLWRLGKYHGDVCYDELRGAIARAINPRWLINSRYVWKKVYSLDVPASVQCAFDASRDVIYIVPDDKSLVELDLHDLRATHIDVVSGVPATNNFSQLVADTMNDRLVSFKIDEGKVSYFDHRERRWSRNKQVFPKSVHWHHTAVFNPTDTTVISFGGYGYYRYNNLLTTFHLNGDSVSRRELDPVMPRYSAASCIVDNNLYIYGGRGSETGMQEIATIYMYDLLRIDLATKEIIAMGDFPMRDETFLPAENMVYDHNENCFYVLTDAHEGSLLRISPDQNEIVFVAAGLPEKMSANHFYRNLFYSPHLHKLYAVFDTYNEVTKQNALTVYSLNSPPLPLADIFQSPPRTVSGKYLMWIILFLVAAGGAVTVRFMVRRRKKRIVKNAVETASAGQIPDLTEYAKERDNRSAIFLLGGFRIFDRDGKNISSRFTPTLRQLLLLLILKAADGKGILSSKIEEHLWEDKDRGAARNNRYVSIRKLRLLLEEVGDIKVNGNNDYWTIDFGGDVYCDYRELKQYLKIKNSHRASVEFSHILLAGPLLPQMELEWLDHYKSSLSNEVVDALHEISESSVYSGGMKMKLRIADAILTHDVLNEEAIFSKCRILYKEGKKSLAATAYESFCKEYRILLEEDYPVSFDSIVSETGDK